jgi:sulfite reductase beta subunit-like hemoprotein
VSEQRYMPLFRTGRMSADMIRALTGFCCHAAKEGINSATEQYIRDYIANVRGEPKLAAKFKVSYLVPAPSDHQDT